VGLAGASAGFLGGQTFVRLDLGLISPRPSDERWENQLIGRLLAGILLRAAGLYDTPGLLAARTSDPGWLRGLQAFAAAFRGAAFYPAIEGKVIPLQTVCAARALVGAILPGARLDPRTGELHGAQGISDRILTAGHGQGVARQRLAVVDLRDLDEPAVIQRARQVYRRRWDRPSARHAAAASARGSQAAVLNWGQEGAGSSNKPWHVTSGFAAFARPLLFLAVPLDLPAEPVRLRAFLLAGYLCAHCRAAGQQG
jgi:hypothetical protein